MYTWKCERIQKTQTAAKKKLINATKVWQLPNDGATSAANLYAQKCKYKVRAHACKNRST